MDSFIKSTRLFFLLSLLLVFFCAYGQNNSSYLKANAIRVDNPNQLSDSVYNLFSPFQIFMVGEMHGTNECAQFVIGLANLLANKGDSVSVGLEIPSEQMQAFIASHTDSSIYQSNFFCCNPDLDGRESFAWASVISHLKTNRKIEIFFFDRNADEGKIYLRDSTMYLKIKKQIQLHPHWKMVTLSGNAHASFTTDEKKTATYLRQDKELNLYSKLCTIYNYYLQGTCNANFGHGLEEKKLGRPINDFDTTLTFDKYVLLLTAKSTFPYTAIYYTKNITASEMVKDHLDLLAIKKELKAIFDRDQKTRTGADSATFMHYIDSCNQVEVKSLIAKYGWMGKSFIGNYNQALFLVIQHADSATQEKYFPMLQQSVDEGESNATDMAMMQDRILMRQGKKQIYGSQVVYGKTGEQIFYPIDDEKNVNIRREKMGLQPMEEYGKYFGIDYKLPKE
jgi:hypothetical protein